MSASLVLMGQSESNSIPRALITVDTIVHHIAATDGIGADALNALLPLGYSDKEALPAIKQLPAGLSLAESIRQALKLLVRK